MIEEPLVVFESIVMGMTAQIHSVLVAIHDKLMMLDLHQSSYLE
jgi:hypothetical protein